MKILLTALLLWLINVASRPGSVTDGFRYERTVSATEREPGSVACATLDTAVYAHAAAASLKDLRLFRQTFSGVAETPYAITLSESAEAESEAAAVRNLGERRGEIVFDLAMPPRPYTDVQLDLDAKNFIASAEVTGSDGEGPPMHLGIFTLFDLSAQRLGRGTTLPLQESTFSVLHIVLRFSPAPGTSAAIPSTTVVRGASVPPSREAQTLYTVVAETASIAQEGKEAIARFALPAHVPVERVSVALQPEFAENFSRDVVVTAHTAADEEDERVTGRVERVRLGRAGREIRQEQLGFAATLGANLQADATVEVRIENGDDAPLPLRSVRLEMRERRLCFPATATGPLTLFYGDPESDAPRYDFARTFSPSARLLRATLSTESLNSEYVARAPRRQTVLERHPELLWVTLLAVVCVLAIVAVHSSKRMAPH